MERPQPPQMPTALTAPTANAADDMPKMPGGSVDEAGLDAKVDWKRLASNALNVAASYVDNNYRKRWEDGLRMFNNQHPLDSKYNHPAYEKRSKLFRPKPRAAIRKNEAAAVAAFFANPEVVNIDPVLQSDQTQKASAEVMKQLIQYRLTSADPRIGVPWFLTFLGAIQDAQTVGVCCSRQYWDYSTGDDGASYDKPCIKLIATENLLIDQAASWVDPIRSSPFVIELIPMYIGEIVERMDKGEWKRYSTGEIRSSGRRGMDGTRQARTQGREDANADSSHEAIQYESVWVERHIHRYQGRDYVFYVLGDAGLLTEPVPLIDEVFTGERDYVMGIVNIETHKIYPAGLPELAKPLSDEINEVANQALDNTKFVLNKRWFVKRGKNVDVGSLVRNVAGGITMMDDPEVDVKEVTWPEVNASGFEAQNRLSADFDDLLGNFSAAQTQLQTNAAQQPAATLQLLAQAPAPLVDYLLHTFKVTWAEPVLRQLVKLEQKYETDVAILAIAADRAKLLQRYGINQVTDELLNKDLTLTIGLVFGAMTPMAKLQRFNAGLAGLANIVKAAIPGLNNAEVAKESFALMGYQDGARFMQEDAQQAQLRQAMAMKDQAIQELTRRLQDKDADLQAKLKIEHDKNETAIATAVLKQQDNVTELPPDPMAELRLKQREIELKHEADLEKIRTDASMKMEEIQAKYEAAIETAKIQAETARCAADQQAADRDAKDKERDAKDATNAGHQEAAKPNIVINNILPKPHRRRAANIKRGPDGITFEMLGDDGDNE